MTIAVYPFFHQTARVIGQQVLARDIFTAADVKRAMIEDRGHLGALEKAVERVVFSLRNWGFLASGSGRNTLVPVYPRLATADVELQSWLLAVAITVYSGEELPLPRSHSPARTLPLLLHAQPRSPAPPSLVCRAAAGCEFGHGPAGVVNLIPPRLALAVPTAESLAVQRHPALPSL